MGATDALLVRSKRQRLLNTIRTVQTVNQLQRVPSAPAVVPKQKGILKRQPVRADATAPPITAALSLLPTGHMGSTAAVRVPTMARPLVPLPTRTLPSRCHPLASSHCRADAQLAIKQLHIITYLHIPLQTLNSRLSLSVVNKFASQSSGRIDVDRLTQSGEGGDREKVLTARVAKLWAGGRALTGT